MVASLLLALGSPSCTTIGNASTPTPLDSTIQSSSTAMESAIEGEEAKIKEIYALYLANGGSLSYEQWLSSIKGEDGEDGKDGKSAYEIYKEAHPEYQGDEAQWLDDLVNGRLSDKETFTVTFDPNNGEAAYSQTVTNGKTVEKPIDPVKEGHTFLGWYDENGDKWSFLGHVVTKDITLTAQWRSEGAYILSVLSEDETKGKVKLLSGNGNPGEVIAVEAIPEEGYYFGGWYEGNEKVSGGSTYRFLMPNDDVFLTARFYSSSEWKSLHGGTPLLSEDEKSVTYGLYPQTHVNDESLIARLNGFASPTENEWYLLDGEYYAKLEAHPYEYGEYHYSDGAVVNEGSLDWFRCEPIEWDVLSNNDGELFLFSKLILTNCVYFDTTATIEEGEVISYRNSTIRQWLNGDFLHSAFHFGEENIVTSTISYDPISPNSGYGPGGDVEDSEDKVFLLSRAEMVNEAYGFSSDPNFKDPKRVRKGTDWMLAKCVGYPYIDAGPCYRLRDIRLLITFDGYLEADNPYAPYYGSAPAMRIKL